MSLREKLIKNSTINYTSTLSDSKIYTKKVNYRIIPYLY